MSVVRIDDHLPKGQINQNIVDILTDWLADAINGELKAIAICGLEPDGASRVSVSRSECFHEMLGAVCMLQHAMTSNPDEL